MRNIRNYIFLWIIYDFFLYAALSHFANKVNMILWKIDNNYNKTIFHGTGMLDYSNMRQYWAFDWLATEHLESLILC